MFGPASVRMRWICMVTFNPAFARRVPTMRQARLTSLSGTPEPCGWTSANRGTTDLRERCPDNVLRLQDLPDRIGVQLGAEFPASRASIAVVIVNGDLRHGCGLRSKRPRCNFT